MTDPFNNRDLRQRDLVPLDRLTACRATVVGVGANPRGDLHAYMHDVIAAWTFSRDPRSGAFVMPYLLMLILILVIALVLARGRAWLGTDLEQATLEVDEGNRRLTLILPAPAVLTAELDLSRTRVLMIHRRGLWQLLPGEAGEAPLIEQALQEAQHQLRAVASHDAHRTAARTQAQRVLEPLADRTGHELTIRWQSP